MWKFLAGGSFSLMMRIVCWALLHTACWVDRQSSCQWLHPVTMLISPPALISSTPGAGFIITIAPWYESLLACGAMSRALEQNRSSCVLQLYSRSRVSTLPLRSPPQMANHSCAYPSGNRRAPPTYKYGERSIFFPNGRLQNIKFPL